MALALLKKAGHHVEAYYMKIWLEDELSFLGECPWEDDLSYARAVCEQFDIPLHIVPFQKEYWERVVGYTIESVKQGLTPNPDMMCNAQVKFGAFFEYLEKEGKNFDFIATGHYANTEVKNGKTYLKVSRDSLKDQTYFLSQLSPHQIEKALFPIGAYSKEQVRELAKTFGLKNALRKDSQGICFLGSIPFDQFIKHHLGEQKGNLVQEETGKVLGAHEGFWYYTVGQRKGIRLSGGPWYVTGKNTETNEIFIAHQDKYVLSAKDQFDVININWIAEIPEKTKLRVKVRHGEKYYEAKIKLLSDTSAQVTLKEHDQGLAEGQFAVFYDDEYCIGGGTISFVRAC